MNKEMNFEFFVTCLQKIDIWNEFRQNSMKRKSHKMRDRQSLKTMTRKKDKVRTRKRDKMGERKSLKGVIRRQTNRRWMLPRRKLNSRKSGSALRVFLVIALFQHSLGAKLLFVGEIS